MNLPASHFLNRELGLIAFNRRVLAQAQDERVPLLERLFFLCIVSSNLDEFFEIRMAGLKEQIKGHSKTRTTDGLLPQEAYDQVSAAVHRLVADQYRELNNTLLPAAASEGIRFLRRSQWTDAQREWIRDYFFREVMPVLTPIGLDPSHPFPRIYNKSLNFIVELEGRDAFGRSSGIAIVQAPRVLPRIIRLPEALAPESSYSFIFLSSIVHAFVGELFSGMTVQGCYQFRVTRNSDLFVDDEEVDDLLREQPGLRLTPSRNGVLRLSGTIEFSAQKPGLERIDDSFEIEIVVPKNFPRNLPVVIEVGGRIPAKFHTDDDGALCLGSPTQQLLAVQSAPTLPQFVATCVIPYLYGFAYHSRHGAMPFGELAHGRKGLRDDFQTLFGVATDEAAVEMVRLAGLKKRVANKAPCPCGSGRRLGKCHNRRVNRLRDLLGRTWFREQHQLLKGSQQ